MDVSDSETQKRLEAITDAGLFERLARAGIVGGAELLLRERR